LADSEAQTKGAHELGEAIKLYFDYRAGVLDREFKELFRIGRRSLAIGLSILATCLVSSHIAGGYLVNAPFKRLVEESLLILGWVANWRPIEIFLYDWRPLARRRNLYRRLAVATVQLKPYRVQQPSEAAGGTER
jgi:hypothetical protein